jgi:uncharacterized protein (TIGR02118 family)
MIKSMSLLERRPDISAEQFHSHWREVHGQLALRITAIRRYVQSHRLRDTITGIPRLSQEGIAEVWLDDIATANALATNPDFTNYAGPDELNFMDRSRSVGLTCHERVIIPGPPLRRDDAGVKVMLFLAARPGADGILEGWLDTRLGPMAGALPGLRRLSLAQPVPADVPACYAAVAELSWPDIAGYDRGWASQAAGSLRQSLAEVTDLANSAGMLVEEYRLVW